MLGVGIGAALLSACNSTNSAAVPTTVVAPPPGCDTSRVVVVGASLDLSGPGAVLGHQYLTGLELGIAKVNGANGVPPRNSCFELAYKDNQGNPTIDTQAMLDLVNVEKAGIVAGTFLGASTASYLGLLGIPAISLSSLATTFEPQSFPNTFPVTASMESQATVMGATLRKQKVRSVAVVVTDDEASREGAARLAAVSAAAGFRIAARATVAPSGAGASAAVSQVRSANPQVLVVLDDTGAVAAVLSARAAQGWRVPVLAGPDTTERSVLSKIQGATGGVTVVVPTGAVVGSGLGSGGTLEFRKQLLAHLGTGTIEGSIIPYAQTYDAMTMMGNAANGAMGVVATGVTSFLQNANYQGVLASYTYTSGAHTGISVGDQTVVVLNSLSNGLLRPPPTVVRAST